MSSVQDIPRKSRPAFGLPLSRSALERSPLGALHRWLITPPADLDPTFRDFYPLSNYTHAFGLLSHVLFLAIFCFLHLEILALVNVASIAIFIGTLAASKRGWLNIALLIGGLEVGTHQGLAVLFLGLAPAFHHYILILAIGTLFYQHIPLKTRIGMAILPIVDYIAMYLYGLHHVPWIVTNSAAIDALAAMNVIFFVSILMGGCLYYQYSVQKARRQAEKMAQAKTLFLANMSHELRTPLNAILGFAQILRRSAGLTAQDQRNLSTIDRSGEHLLRLINDVLDMSKLEEGKFALDCSSFDLHQLLSELRMMFSLAATQKGLDLDFEQSPDLPQHIRGDELRLRQVLINLLSNALKFTARGAVRVIARKMKPAAGGEVELNFQVRDSGDGIAPEELDDLFKLFSQTAAGRQSRRGAGLGLALSKRFVELMGGRIRVESEVGRGSVFSFDLPVELDSPLPKLDGKPLRIAGVREGSQRHRMLVVDDNNESRDLLLQFLAGLGFHVESAVDGAEGVAKWAGLAPDLVWMDLQMPVLDGREACRIIRQQAQAAGRDAPKIVAITASILAGDRTPREQMGFDDFVNKPFREADIHAVLKRLLDVEFIYAPPEPSGSEPSPARPENDLAGKLALLDPSIRGQLAHASTLADFEGAQQAIRRIGETHPALAGSLNELLESYRFDVLQELTQALSAKAPSDR